MDEPTKQPEQGSEFPEELLAKGARIESHDHPTIAKDYPELIPVIVKDELKLDPGCYDDEEEPGEKEEPETPEEDVLGYKRPGQAKNTPVSVKDSGILENE